MLKRKKTSEKINNFVRRKIGRGFSKTYLPEIAEERRAKLLNKKMITRSFPDIYSVFDELSKHIELERPLHLDPFIKALQKGCEENVKLVFHAPPRHGKSVSVLVSLLWSCMTQNKRRHLYVTYNEDRATDVAEEFIWLAKILGLKYKKTKNTVYIHKLNSQASRSNNCVHFTSIKGSVTGRKVEGLVIIDNPIKGDEAATSDTQKVRAYNFYTKEISTRRSNDFSVICMMTRWSHDDLSGKLIDDGFPYVRIPAIADDTSDPVGRKLGEALWPNQRPIEMLKEQEIVVGDYVWSAMYQGVPYKEGFLPFDNLEPIYEEVDFSKIHDWVTTYGIDLAYSEKKTSDYNVMVQLKTSRTTGITYITNILREQQLHDKFFAKVVRFVEKEPGKIHWHTGGLEDITVAANLRRTYPHVNLTTYKATKGKYVRALNSKIIEDFTTNYVRISKTLYGKRICQEFIKDLQLYTPTQHLGSDSLDALSSGYNAVKHIVRALQKAKIPKPTKREREQEEKWYGMEEKTPGRNRKIKTDSKRRI
jgi:hypothetical protein